MKRLLFVINQFYKGGAETSLLNLFKYLDKSKYEIDIIIMNQILVEGAVSLLDRIPKEVNIFDVQKEQMVLSPLKKLQAKMFLKKEDIDCDPTAALLFAREHEYDVAFHVGEWWSPRFVAKNIKAKRKCAWIHNDIAQAEYFDAENYFVYDEYFSHYIFVSNNSMESSLERYPFIREKAICIYNINDAEMIKREADCPMDQQDQNYYNTGVPVVLTCANIRQQKKHKRALEAMGILAKRGVEFIWINIGAITEQEHCNRLLSRAEELGLKDRFILAGPKNNPYPYIKQADVIAVLSDYESWSMVITEAKILGKPIISTRTSGALEQIKDRETGLLTDFDANDIADKLEELLESKKLQEVFHNNLISFNNTEEILKSFDELIEEKPTIHKKELLYIIDDINYLGGAHIATKLQIREFLKKGKSISVFSNTIPNVQIRNELAGVYFVPWAEFREDAIFHRRLLDCLFDFTMTFSEKCNKFRMSFRCRIKKDPNVFEEMVMPGLSKLFSGFDTVCVMSEGSALRRYVADSDSKNKVQWIHIDYCDWMNSNPWASQMSANDSELYKRFDKIVMLSSNIRDKFVALYPHLKDKVVINKNLIPVDDIRDKSKSIVLDFKPLQFVTVCRIDYQKGLDRLFRVLLKMYQKGYRYKWDIVGGGDKFEEIREMFSVSPIKNLVSFTGPLSNPFPIVKQADVFALLSNFEGLPNTIFEALILGVPVLATDVGGVCTQIDDNETGWLVDNDEKEILNKLEYIMSHPEEVDRVRENLKDYSYDNSAVLEKAETILFQI